MERVDEANADAVFAGVDAVLWTVVGTSLELLG
jgi:hypothetical protein